MKRLFTFMAFFAQVLLLVNCSEKQTNNMKYRNLGNTDVKISEIGIGCGAFGKMTPEESRAFMDTAIANGINYIDLYDANPKVRDNIGYAIKGRTDKMMVQGHVGVCWKDGQYKKTRDVAEAKAGFEDLLTRLGVSSIEVGMIHIADSPEEWREIQGSEFLEYVKQLKKEGKIKHIGLSSHNAEAALLAVKSGLVEVLMFSMNPAFDRIASSENIWDKEAYKNMLPGIDPIRVELYDYCATHKIAITAMKVFGGGGKLLSAESSPLGIALTPVQCISYCLSKPCVASALCGASTVGELQDDLQYLLATAQEKDYNAVLESLNSCENQGLGECTYCTHCAPCPKALNIAEINRLLDKALQDGKVSPELQAEYDNLGKYASDCIQCGACETRCPFDVPIMERMKKAVEIFGK